MVRGKGRGRRLAARVPRRKVGRAPTIPESVQFVESLWLRPKDDPLHEAYIEARAALSTPLRLLVPGWKETRAKVRRMQQIVKVFGPSLLEYCRLFVRECGSRGLLQEGKFAGDFPADRDRATIDEARGATENAWRGRIASEEPIAQYVPGNLQGKGLLDLQSAIEAEARRLRVIRLDSEADSAARLKRFAHYARRVVLNWATDYVTEYAKKYMQRKWKRLRGDARWHSQGARLKAIKALEGEGSQRLDRPVAWWKRWKALRTAMQRATKAD